MKKADQLTPTILEVDELLSFQNRLCGKGFKPIQGWESGGRVSAGEIGFPKPMYEQAVIRFFGAASKACWVDPDYSPDRSALVDDPAKAEDFNLKELKAMLTYCVRGERFFAGHWSAMIEQGYICRLLQRLRQLRKSLDERWVTAQADAPE